MFIEFLVLLLGVISGTITGLLPGIHNNLVTTILVSCGFIYDIPINLAIIYIVSISVTHTFVDFIPTIYFFSGSSDTALATTPGQKMFMNGNGHLAINNTIKGSILAIFAFLIIYFPLTYFLTNFYSKIEIMFSWIMLWVVIFSICRAEFKLETILIIFMSGCLGYFVLNSSINQPLLPMLTGFFGIANLITSQESEIIKQNTTEEKITFKEIRNILLKTIIVSPFCSLMPGLGASQASMFLPSKKDDKETMILLGSINTLVLCTSFVTLFLVNKNRSGAASAISQLTTLTSENILMIILVIVIASVLAAAITNFISKKICCKIEKINIRILKKIILIITTIIVVVVSGFRGLIVLVVSVMIGILAIKFRVAKTNMMSCILVSTMFYYLP